MKDTPPAIVRATVLGLASLMLGVLANGCSAGPDSQTVESSHEALTSCGAPTCGSDPPDPPADISQETGAVCPGYGGPCSYGVPVPSSLAGHGCTTGVYDNGGYVFACPSRTPVPTSMFPIGGSYIEEVTSSTTYCDACVGPPNRGFKLILDGYAGIGGGCRGPCADPN
jgi:hypothetical protein